MYKKILVAIDDSETSRSALREALHIAKTSNAKLVITHVADETLLNMHHHVFAHMADADNNAVSTLTQAAVSYTHLTLPTSDLCRSRWSPYH